MIMLSVIATIIFGGLGWAIAKLLFEPLKEILDLRRDALECMIVYGDLSVDAPPDIRRSAGEEFRRVGAGLVSRHFAAYRWVKWWYEVWGLDIHSAGAELISIGNGTQFGGISCANNLATVPIIRARLKLPPPEQSPLTRELMEHGSGPAPINNLHA